jgi:hypothetical protein
MKYKYIFSLFVYIISVAQLFGAIGGYQKLPWSFEYKYAQAKEACSDLGMTLGTIAELKEVKVLANNSGEYWTFEGSVYRMSDNYIDTGQSKENYKGGYCVYYGSSKPSPAFIKIDLTTSAYLDPSKKRWAEAKTLCESKNMSLPSYNEMKIISKSGGTPNEYWTRDIINANDTYMYRIDGSNKWIKDFYQSMQNVNYKNAYCYKPAPTQEQITITDVDTLIRVDAGTSEIIDKNFSMACSSVKHDIGSIEITNADSSPGDTSYIEYNSTLVTSLDLTVQDFVSNGQIIFTKVGGLTSSNWESFFKTMKFKTSVQDLSKTKKVTFTLKNSPKVETLQNLQLGAVSTNPETSSSLTTTLAKWTNSDVNITAYDGVNQTIASTNVVTITRKTQLAEHVSTGLGVNGKSGDDGQIDWINDSKLPSKGYAEKIVMKFAKPLTDITVGFSGLGGRFTAAGGAKAVYEFYYKDVLVRSRGKLDREADFDGDGYVATNKTTTNLIVDKMIFTIQIDGTNYNSANFSVRYITANYYKTPTITECEVFTRNYIVQIVEKKHIHIGDTADLNSTVSDKSVGVSFPINFLSTNYSGKSIPFGSEGNLSIIDINGTIIQNFGILNFTGSSYVKDFNISTPKNDIKFIFKTVDGEYFSNLFNVKFDMAQGSCKGVNILDYQSFLYYLDDSILSGKSDFNLTIKFAGEINQTENNLFSYSVAETKEIFLRAENGLMKLKFGTTDYELSNINTSDIFSNNYNNFHIFGLTWNSLTSTLQIYLDGILNETIITSISKLSTNGLIKFGGGFKGNYQYISILTSSNRNKTEWDMNSFAIGNLYNKTYPLYYKDSNQKNWSNAKTVCESRGMKLPTRSDISSYRSVFSTNGWVGTNFWSSEVTGSNAYIYRFQNGNPTFWGQESQPQNNQMNFVCIGSTASTPLIPIGKISSISGNCQISENLIKTPEIGSCGGVEVGSNGGGYLKYDQNNVSIPTTGYKHSSSQIWSSAKTICESRGMKLPTRSEIGSYQSVFSSNGWFNQEYWTNDEINSNEAYMFRFQNGTPTLWTQNMQKQNGKNIYCIPNALSYQLVKIGDFNLTMLFSGDGDLVEWGTNFKIFKVGDEVHLSINNISAKLDISANDIFDGVLNNLVLRFKSLWGVSEIYFNGKLIQILQKKDWINKGLETGSSGTFGKGFTGEFKYLALQTTGKSAIWDMNKITLLTLKDSNETFNLALVGDAMPIDKSCQNSGVILIPVKYNFKVREKGNTDFNITTKIAGKPFELEFLAFEDNGSSKNYDGNITTELIDSITNIQLYDIGVIKFNDTNISSKNLNISKISKNCKIKIESTDSNGTKNIVYSDDNFSIRPDKFNLTIPSSAIAGNNISISAQALNFSNAVITDYNESNLTTSSIDFNYSDIKNGCITEKLSGTNLSIAFSKGSFTISPKYPEIGRLKFSISERIGNEFAKIDLKDTTINSRLITPAEVYIDFNLSKIKFFSTLQPQDQNYTYYSNDLSKMAGKLSVKYEAQNIDGNKTRNFKNGCYSENIDTNISFAGIIDGLNLKTVPKANISMNQINRELNSTVFIDGETNISYSFNFERNISKPLNPSMISIKEIILSKYKDISSYKHTSQLRWNEAKALCESKKLKLPNTSDLSSIQSIFKTNSWNGEYWANEIDSNLAYMFRFQNGTPPIWYQNMQKVNYKEVFCLGTENSSSSLIGSIPFYYARIVSPDVRVKGDEANVSLILEIYNDSNLSKYSAVYGEKSSSNNWFKHNEVNDSFINETNLSTPFSYRIGINKKTLKLKDQKEGSNIEYSININTNSMFLYNIFDDNITANFFDIYFEGNESENIESEDIDTFDKIKGVKGKRVEW